MSVVVDSGSFPFSQEIVYCWNIGLWLNDSVFPMQDYSLSDDTVLDKINLAEPDQYELPDLRAEEQAVILGVW